MQYRIIYRNTLTKKVSVFTGTDTGGKRFYRFALPLGLEAGFYEYYVCEAGGTLVLYPNDVRKSTVDGHTIAVYDCGMARVGKIERGQTITYNIDRTYEQYR